MAVSLSRLNHHGGWGGTLSCCPTKRDVNLVEPAPPLWCKAESPGAHSPAMKCFSEVTHEASSIHTNHRERASAPLSLKATGKHCTSISGGETLENH